MAIKIKKKIKMIDETESHGKLIDADALLIAVNEQINVLKESQDWCRIYGAIIIRDMIEKAPIIEVNEVNNE